MGEKSEEGVPLPKSKLPYPGDVRREAMELVRASGTSRAAGARDLGIASESLRIRIRQAEIDAGRGRPHELTTSEREDLARLRRQVRTLELGREIPKNAAAFGASETL